MERSMDYCDVCGISHSMKYRHLYTKRHQQNALNACKKLHRKKEACMGLANAIEFQQLPFNTETKIWCPTCSLEVKVHYVARDSIAIPNYGTFLHFSSSGHQESASKFINKNRLHKNIDAMSITISKQAAESVMEKINQKLDSMVTHSQRNRNEDYRSTHSEKIVKRLLPSAASVTVHNPLHEPNQKQASQSIAHNESSTNFHRKNQKILSQRKLSDPCIQVQPYKKKRK